MEKSPVLSVIVPIYNVEFYLNKCIDSILVQTFDDFELILVDDGSPDQCGDICEKYGERDQRIIVIHQKNTGVSAARNTGLNIAKGKYISFIDPDDWIEADMYKMLIDNALEYKADIAICNYRYDYANGRTKKYSDRINTLVLDSREAMKCLIEGKPYDWSLCNKIYNKNLFGLSMSKNRLTIGEDFMLNFNLFKNSKKVIYDPKCKYHYFQRSDSVTHISMTKNQVKELLLVNEYVYRKVIKWDKSLYKSAVFRYVSIIISVALDCAQDFRQDSQKKSFYLVLKNKLRNKKIIGNKYLKISQKIYGICICVLPYSLFFLLEKKVFFELRNLKNIYKK